MPLTCIFEVERNLSDCEISMFPRNVLPNQTSVLCDEFASLVQCVCVCVCICQSGLVCVCVCVYLLVRSGMVDSVWCVCYSYQVSTIVLVHTHNMKGHHWPSGVVLQCQGMILCWELSALAGSQQQCLWGVLLSLERISVLFLTMPYYKG